MIESSAIGLGFQIQGHGSEAGMMATLTEHFMQLGKGLRGVTMAGSEEVLTSTLG